MADKKKDYEAAWKQVSAEAEKVKKELSGSQTALKKSQTEFATLKEKATALEKQLESARLSIQTHEQAMTTLQKNHEKSQADLALSEQKTTTLKNQLESARLSIQTHERDMAIIQRKYKNLHNLAACRWKNLVAVGTLLELSDILPFTHLLDKVDTFNGAVTKAGKYLARNVVRRSPEAFPEEIDRAHSDVEALMGQRLANVFASEARHDTLERLKGALAHTSRILLQTFIIRFCVLNIKQLAVFTRDGATSVFKGVLSPSLSSYETPTLEQFKKSLLKMLSSVFKVAGWALLGAQTRAGFMDLLDPLYGARESLRIAVAETFRDASIEVLLVDQGILFDKDIAIDFLGLHDEEGTDEVAGVMGVGLVKDVSSLDSLGGHHELKKTILRAQVVLQRGLQRAHENEGKSDNFSEDSESNVDVDGLSP